MTARIAEALTQKAGADPKSRSSPQYDLWVGYMMIGDLERQRGNAKEALVEFKKGLPIALGLAEEQQVSTAAMRAKAITYERIGNALADLEQFDEALDSLQTVVSIHRWLAAHDEKNLNAHFDVAIGFERVGDILEQLGRLDTALSNHEESLRIRESLRATDENNAQLQSALVKTYGKISLLQARIGSDTTLSREDRLKYWRRSQEMGTKCFELSELMKKQRTLPRDIEVDLLKRVIANLGTSEDAIRDLLETEKLHLEDSIEMARRFNSWSPRRSMPDWTGPTYEPLPNSDSASRSRI